MKNLITLLIIGAILMKLLGTLDESLTPSSKSGAPIGFQTNYDTALSLAQSSGKPLVVIFSASWCPPCQQMKKQVYPSQEVAPYKSQFVWAYLDVDQPSNQIAAQKFGVRGIPHIAFLNAQGTEIATTAGGMPPEAFAAQLKSALAGAH
jgi:thioredoxin-like negative regulator of GroEL